MQSYPIPRAARILFQKTGKGFVALHARGARGWLTNKPPNWSKKKKASVDSNRQFADIEKMTTAQRAWAAQTEAWQRQNSVRARRLASNRMIEGRMEDYMVNWHVNSVDIA
jgi:hypothetical protein